MGGCNTDAWASDVNNSMWGGEFTGTGKAEGRRDQRKERAVQVDRLSLRRPGVHVQLLAGCVQRC